MVPLRYHPLMAMNLRLDDNEAIDLRRAAAKAGMSMQQAARVAIHEWVARTEGMTMGQLMARPPLGGAGRPPPGWGPPPPDLVPHPPQRHGLRRRLRGARGKARPAACHGRPEARAGSEPALRRRGVLSTDRPTQRLK